MSPEVEQHLAAVEAFYRPIVQGPPPLLAGGAALWAQYEQARDAYARSATSFGAVYERINEMAAAHILLTDPTLDGTTAAYENPIATDGSLIDFSVSWPRGRTLYVEVKTVHPRTKDGSASWANYERRRKRHPERAAYVVQKDWLGGELYGNSFSARAHFMEYTCQFEQRLAAAAAVRPGEGVLLVCGTGMKWHLSELEDFADFYRLGAHRTDDVFGPMEAHDLAERSIELKRNISEFAYLKRPMDSVTATQWFAKVQGPLQGRGGHIDPACRSGARASKM